MPASGEMKNPCPHPACLRREVIAHCQGVRPADGTAPSSNRLFGSAPSGAAKAIVEDNVIESADPDPIKLGRCGQVRCMGNSTPQGMPIRGINAPYGNEYDDLPAKFEDAMIAVLL